LHTPPIILDPVPLGDQTCMELGIFLAALLF